MASRVGLYYPWIHFRNDDWVKLAALYWSKVGRIVPPGYDKRDSPVVQTLVNELDLIQDVFSPASSSSVGTTFVRVVTDNGDKLRERFGVDKAEIWAEPARHFGSGPSWEPPDRFAYIHVAKLPCELRDQLFESGLAIQGRAGDGQWVGVHPQVAGVYMTALADVIATKSKFHPVTEDALHHVAASGWSVRRLAGALLDDEDIGATEPSEESARRHEPVLALSFLAIQSVAPTELSKVSVEKIVRVRKDYGPELTASHDGIASLAEAESLGEIEDEDALLTHLTDTYNTRVRPQLDTLRHDLRHFGIETGLTAVDVNLAAPALVTSGVMAAGVDIPPVMLAAGGAIALARFGHSQHRKRQDLVRTSPVAYLLRVERALEPEGLAARVQRALHRFAR